MHCFLSLLHFFPLFIGDVYMVFVFLLKGAVPKGNATKEMIQQMGFREGQMFFKCHKCCSIKPERAHHCSVCQR